MACNQPKTPQYVKAQVLTFSVSCILPSRGKQISGQANASTTLFAFRSFNISKLRGFRESYCPLYMSCNRILDFRSLCYMAGHMESSWRSAAAFCQHALTYLVNGCYTIGYHHPHYHHKVYKTHTRSYHYPKPKTYLPHKKYRYVRKYPAVSHHVYRYSRRG